MFKYSHSTEAIMERTVVTNASPMEALRARQAQDTLIRVGRDLAGLADETKLKNPRIRDNAFVKAAESLKRNPMLTHKTLAKAVFYLALEETSPENIKDSDVVRTLNTVLNQNESWWFTLAQTLRRELANAHR